MGHAQLCVPLMVLEIKKDLIIMEINIILCLFN